MTITSPNTVKAKAGAQSNIRFQLASVTPITRVAVALNGVEAAVGSGPVVGLWFRMPTPGSYAVTLTATNGYGCTRASVGVRTVISQ